MNFQATRQVIFSHLTPQDLLSVSAACKEWHAGAHVTDVVQRVISSFDCAIGALLPVKYKAEHCWDELLNRCSIQAWVEKEVVTEECNYSYFGVMSKDDIPYRNLGNIAVLRNWNHPDFISIYSNKLPFILFDCNSWTVTHTRKKQFKKLILGQARNPHYQQDQFQTLIKVSNQFTDRLSVRTNGRTLICAFHDSKTFNKIVMPIDLTQLIACEDLITTMDTSWTIRKLVAERDKFGRNTSIPLRPFLDEYPSLAGYEIEGAKFINIKQPKGSCIVALHLVNRDKNLLIFLYIKEKQSTLMGQIEIDSIERLTTDVDHAASHIMVHQTDTDEELKSVHLVDCVNHRCHDSGDVLLQGRFHSYNDGRVAMYLEDQTVQIWSFVPDGDSVKPFLIRTVQLKCSRSKTKVVKLFRTGFVFSEPTVASDTYTAYRLDLPMPLPKPKNKKRSCLIQ